MSVIRSAIRQSLLPLQNLLASFVLILLTGYAAHAAQHNVCWVTGFGSSWCGGQGGAVSCMGSMSGIFGILPEEYTDSALAGLNGVTQKYFELVGNGVSGMGCSLDSCVIGHDHIFSDGNPPTPSIYFRGLNCQYTCSSPPKKRTWYISDLSTYQVVSQACGSSSYVIKLSNDTNLPASGDLAEVEPGKATTALRATVYDSNNAPASNVNVKLEVTVAANSGGHQHHDNTRPKGLLSNGVSAGVVVEGYTGSDGMPFTFLAPAPAGDHKIVATCTDRTCKQEGADTVWVGIKGLVPLLPTSGDYVLVGQQPSHPHSHYLKPVVAGQVGVLAIFYRQRFPKDPLLHLNDASLERGGLFDINAAHSLLKKRKPWLPPHISHRQGTDIDVRANSLPTAIPRKNFAEFRRLVQKIGGAVIAEDMENDNAHFHLFFKGS